MKTRGLHGVEFIVADDHAGLRVVIREVLPEAAYQRCYVYFLRNALDHLPRKHADDCLQEYAGCTTAEILLKRKPTLPPGLPSGPADMPGSLG